VEFTRFIVNNIHGWRDGEFLHPKIEITKWEDEMKVNSAVYNTPDEVRQALEQRLPLSQSSLSDVEAFLKDQEMNCGSPYYLNEDNFQPINPNVDRLTTRKFNRNIICKIPISKRKKKHSIREIVRAWFYTRLFTSSYRIEFHFWDETLVEIIVAQDVRGF
jgi:hypothetical protein